MVASVTGEIMNANNKINIPEKDGILVLRGCFLKLVNNNHIAAAFLNQIFYWRDKMGRTFYKTDADFAEELHISIHKFRRIKRNIIKELPFIHTSLKKTHGLTHYEVDFDILNAMLPSNDSGEVKEVPELVVSDSNTQKREEEVSHTELSLSRTVQRPLNSSAQVITETKTEITKKQTTKDVVVKLEIFKEKEKAIASKLLSTLTHDQQIAVIAVMMVAIRTKQISNKIGYLRSIIKAVQDGTFTAASEDTPTLTSAQVIQREKERNKAQEALHKVDNDSFFADLKAKFGKTGLVTEK